MAAKYGFLKILRTKSRDQNLQNYFPQIFSITFWSKEQNIYTFKLLK